MVVTDTYTISMDFRKNDDLEISAATYAHSKNKTRPESAVKVCDIVSQNCVTHKITHFPAHLARKKAEKEVSCSRIMHKIDVVVGG